MHVSTLVFRGQPIHWHFGLRHGRRFYWYKMAYDAAFAAYSPGKVHVALLLEECMRDGVEVFDFLCGDEAYKFAWTSRFRRFYRLEWWNGLRPVKRMVRRVPPPILAGLRRVRRGCRGGPVRGEARP
jgi:hypothetical protein